MLRPAVALAFALFISRSGALCSPLRNSDDTSQATVQLFNQAQEMASEGRFQDAARIYEKIVDLDPHSFEALNDLGVVYSHLGYYGQAARAYQRALSLQPDSFPVLMNLGIAYVKSGDFRNATEPLGRAVAFDPENFQARALLGLSQYSVKDYVGACGNLEKAVASQPGNSALEYMLGETYLRTGQERKLIDAFHQIDRDARSSATDHLLLATAYEGLGRTDDAIRQFIAAAAIAPNALDVHFGLGYLYWKQHDYTRAAAEFEREMEAAGWVAESEVYLGDIDLRLRKWDAAQAMLEQAIRLNPRIGLAHLDLGTIFARRKDFSRATAELQMAVQLDPELAAGYERLAQLYAAEGERRMERVELARASKVRSWRQDEVLKEADRIPPP